MMERKIVDIKTITEDVRESVKSAERTEVFDRQCRELVLNGWSLHGALQITYTPTVDMRGPTPGYGSVGGGIKSLTQQFVKYEDDPTTNILPQIIKQGDKLLCIDDVTSTNGGNCIKKMHTYIAIRGENDILGFNSVRVEGGGHTDWDTKHFIILP